MQENVLLIDSNDQIIGTMEKMEAHVQGLLHRAFSIFIFNTQGKLLMQQRAHHKYHSGGKWTNTCCSHPRPGEDTMKAATRRLTEEMGMVCSVSHAFSFLYHANIQHGIIEHEYDHVFFGISDDAPEINKDEVFSYKYISIDELEREIEINPDVYTQWLVICFDRVKQHYEQLVKPRLST